MSQQVLFFDLGTSLKPRKAWSPNPWKTRLVLNYKGIPYKTEFLEFPSIAPTLKDLNIPANPDPKAIPYTVPAVKLPSGKAFQDSWIIAQELESAFPDTPSLHLDSPYVKKVLDLVQEAVGALFPTFVADIPNKLLNPVSAEYFRKTREEAFGVTPDVFQEKEGGKKAWDNATPVIGKLVALLQEHPEGPFFEGATVTYADFLLVALLHFLHILGVWSHALDVFEASKQGGKKAAEDLYAASAKWLDRDEN